MTTALKTFECYLRELEQLNIRELSLSKFLEDNEPRVIRTYPFKRRKVTWKTIKAYWTREFTSLMATSRISVKCQTLVNSFINYRLHTYA